MALNNSSTILLGCFLIGVLLLNVPHKPHDLTAFVTTNTPACSLYASPECHFDISSCLRYLMIALLFAAPPWASANTFFFDLDEFPLHKQQLMHWKLSLACAGHKISSGIICSTN